MTLPWGGGEHPRAFVLTTLTGTCVRDGVEVEETMLRLRCSGCVFVFDSKAPATVADHIHISQEMVSHMGRCRLRSLVAPVATTSDAM
jgi:hypothetical protein